MIGIFWVAFALVCALVIIQGLVLLEVLRQMGEMRERLERRNEPEALPTHNAGQHLLVTAELANLELAAPMRLHDLLGQSGTAIVFLHSGCGSCQRVAQGLDELMTLQRPDVVVVPLVGAHDIAEAREFAAANGLTAKHVWFDENDAVSRELRVTARPAVLTVRGSIVNSLYTVFDSDSIDVLLQDVLGATPPSPISGGAEEFAVTGTSSVATKERKLVHGIDH